ncbi:MAG: hypothetical protein D4R43_01950 [Sphingobacteriales bacterium]|nr:MAG: hypothetical protein D4R43_01950 [Sphingobacteriales bacterium]
MDANKSSQFLTNKIIQNYCITMALLDDYCKQTADATREHPESIKKRILLSGEKIKIKLLEEIAALNR